MSVTFGDYRMALTGGFSMDDDDSYLYGASNVDEPVKPALQTSGESQVGSKRVLSPTTSSVLPSLSAMEILMKPFQPV